MRAVFMGTPDFSVGTLEAMIRAGHRVEAVFTQPDKPKGRGKSLQMTPVKEAALAHGIPVYQPRKIREEENVKILKEIDPDVIVVVAFGQIIPQSVLDIPRYGCINVHASLLPKYRGAAPIQWAVIDGEETSGVTIMQMDAGLDTGDMLLKGELTLDEEETGGSLFDRLSSLGAGLLVEALEKLEQGTLTPEKQPEESPTPYAAQISKAQGEIDWGKSAKEIERLIRGLDPWPSAYTHLNGKTLKIWKARAGEREETGGQAGEILERDKNSLTVQTGQGVLVLLEVQLEGKKRMDTGAFLRGFPVETGTVLK